MNKLVKKTGRLVFWLAYPALLVYLSVGRRTRVLVVVDEEVLVVKGWIGTDKWQLPGGGLHRGEDSVGGALRELFEETGVKLKPSQLKFFYQDLYRQRGIRFKYSCYTCELSAKPATKKQPREIVEIAWLPLSQISATNAGADTYQAVQSWLNKPNLL